jgi:hypothetical protein
MHPYVRLPRRPANPAAGTDLVLADLHADL